MNVKKGADCRVVVIDDSADERELIERMVTSARGERRYIPIGYADPIDFLQDCRELRFDCILLDYRIPGVTCTDILRAIQELGNRQVVPVIVMSGYGDEEKAMQTMRAGAFDYMLKDSVSSERLALAIESVLVRASLAEELANQQRHLEQALQLARAGLQAKTDFMAKVSHELRTPMNGIMGMLELALESEGEVQRTHLEQARSSANKMLSLVDDLLDVSILELDTFELEKDYFSLSEVLDGVRESLVVPERTKEVAFVCDIAEGVPSCLYGDRKRLRQVLWNLTVNAVKFSPESSEVSIRVRVAKEGNPVTLEFAVIDKGIGIPAEKQQEIFKAFSQAHSSISLQYGGVGIGLAIASRLVQVMGGSIELDSEEGKGSEFHFSLELNVGDTQSVRGLSSELDQATPSGATSSPPSALHVLVVEDTLVNQRLICSILKKLSYTYEVANDGLEAVSAYQAHRFDLILMDIRMPNMDGMDATRAIRAFEVAEGRARVPIVAVTANAVAGDRERFLAIGMDEYVSKPYKRKDLIAAIALVCSNQDAGGGSVREEGGVGP